MVDTKMMPILKILASMDRERSHGDKDITVKCVANAIENFDVSYADVCACIQELLNSASSVDCGDDLYYELDSDDLIVALMWSKRPNGVDEFTHVIDMFNVLKAVSGGRKDYFSLFGSIHESSLFKEVLNELSVEERVRLAIAQVDKETIVPRDGESDNELKKRIMALHLPGDILGIGDDWGNPLCHALISVWWNLTYTYDCGDSDPSELYCILEAIHRAVTDPLP